ncbi:MAG: isochorismate synthase [Nitriliruptoraceae bacterium]
MTLIARESSVAPLKVTSQPLITDVRLVDLIPDVADATVWSTVDASTGLDEGLVGWGRAAVIKPPAGPARFADGMRALGDVAATATIDDTVDARGSGLVAFGSFTFDDDAAGSVMIVPQVIVGRRDGTTWLTEVTPVDGSGVRPLQPVTDTKQRTARPVDTDRPRYAGATRSDVQWLEAVAAAIDRIRQGDVDKVVLARDLAVWSRTPFDPNVLARRLQRHFPSCHTFVVDGLVGATPELLVGKFSNRVTSRVLAGTIGRDHDPRSDDELAARLMASDKDRREHALAVDSVRDVLSARCRDLAHDDDPTVLKLENVQHLATWFEGTLDAVTDVLSLAAALHPTAAVGGTPRQAALALLRDLEGIDRGRYAAPVGWTDASGDGEWGIALRCAELAGTRARLFAGVGIVEGSLPEAELAETRLKLLAMQAVLGESADLGR